MNSPGFFIYDASAGSGKTYTITKAYLSILLKQDQVFAFQNILAITFTNKAAAEMKQRIIEALVYFSGLQSENSHEDLLQDVSSEIHLSKADIQKKSLQILKYLIPNYAGFEVSTIDSFNHRIIRTFANDLRLTQNFEIDLETKPYIDRAVENLIEDVGIDEELTEWLVDFVHYKINRDKSGDIHLDLNKYAYLILNENNYTALKNLQQISLKDLKSSKFKIFEKTKQTKQELVDLALEFFNLIEFHNIEVGHFKANSIPKYFKKLRDGNIPDQFTAKWHNIKETDFYNKTTKVSIAEEIDAIRPEIEDLFLKSKDLCLEYHLSEKVLKSFVPLAMISEINNRINHIKAEEGILFVNDFNHIISKHIKHQPAPFIYERLGEKFRHYFIDEFQDTSKLQWQNLIPLVDNAITSQHDDAISGNLYLVGDVKQSIYEWRGGDPKQFLDLSQGHSNPFSIDPKQKSLDNNWRSAKAVVEFNNNFFNFAADFLTDSNHQKLYRNATQGVKKTLEGYVDIRFLPKEDDKELMDKQRIQSLKDIISSLKSKDFALSDICILVRKNKFGTAIAEGFNEMDDPIPVVSQESLLIASDAQVHLMSVFLSLIEHYHEEVCVDFMLLWFEHINYNQSDCHLVLNKIKNLKPLEFFDHLKNFEIDFDLLVYENLSLYDKAEYVLRALHLDKGANAYIQFYLDEIFDFAMAKSKSMSHFLNYWAEQKHRKSISTSEQSEAVKIMTIHKSKGLQFPVVIYAHANFVLADLRLTEDWITIDENRFGVPHIYEQISKKSQGLSPSFEEAYHRNISKQELTNLNAAYVCMTRAVEQLYIVSEPIKGRDTFKELLINYLKKEAVYEDDKNHFTFGLNESKNVKADDRPLEFDHVDFNSYAAQDFYRELTAEIEVKPNKNKAIVYGQNIHDILQKINYIEDLDYLKIPKEFNSILYNIINHQDISVYFKKPWSIFNEKEIIFEHQIFRPDRICIHGDNAVIIDYKTGSEEPKHLEQLTKYKNALEALGFSVEKAILVYIRKDIYIKTL